MALGSDGRGRRRETDRRRYPSDLSDAQWRGAHAVIGGSTQSIHRDRADVRRVLDAINYRWRTGCAWRMLPHDFPPWQTVYRYFRRWRREGRLTELRDVVLRPRVRDAGRDQFEHSDWNRADVEAISALDRTRGHWPGAACGCTGRGDRALAGVPQPGRSGSASGRCGR